MEARNTDSKLFIIALILFTGSSFTAVASETASVQAETSQADEVLDVREQVQRGITAYDRGDYGKAFLLLSKTSIVGGPEAHYRLGLMYAMGLGTRKNPRLAAYWLEQAAKGNHPAAAEALATLRQSDASG